MKVSELLDAKGRSVSTVDRHATVLEAVLMMNHQGIGSLVVVDDRVRPIGIVTERDVLRQITGAQQSAEFTRVDDIMSTPPVTVGAGVTVAEAMRVMTNRRVRHLPVVSNDRLVGLLSVGDVMKAITDDLEQDVRLLEDYVTGRPGYPFVSAS